jgi:hypothetical protein
LSPPPPSSIMKVSSPTITRTVDASSVTATNGFHHSSKRQVNNIKRRVMQTDLSIFVLIDEKKCRFFSILSIHTLNVAFFTRDKRESTVIFLRLQPSLITLQFVVVVQYPYIAHFFSHCFNLPNYSIYIDIQIYMSIYLVLRESERRSLFA